MLGKKLKCFSTRGKRTELAIHSIRRQVREAASLQTEAKPGNSGNGAGIKLRSLSFKPFY
ncbi:hypothetical protein NDA00_16560 [Funiculus sociatus GB2-M2]|uniref:hypothetical protein n=1 Tax=Trichocoleus sp. FACHB-90 TaxID=2692876 RepID=UPI0016857BA4|nr:hypothetical protein [Trichocoleus sp. FACHB-90]